MASRDVKRADKTRPAKLLSFPFHSLFGLAARPATHNNQNPHRRHTDRGHDDADRKWSWNGDRSNDRDRDRNYNRDRDGRSRSSKERDKDIDKKRTRIAIYLEDLDHRHNSFTLLVRRGLEVGKLGETIRERLKDHGRPLSDSARVRFYADARELGRQDVADSYATIWYRLVTPRDNDTWMITHLGDDTNGRVDTSLADEMVRCIEAGKTLADLRKVVARHMSIDDSNRIIIIARDGLRKGLLQGDMWQVRQIRSWFSRWLSIDVSPKKGYIIIEGSWGQYLLHPSSELSSGGLAVRDVKQWLETRLLNDVDRLQNSKLELKYHKIALTYRGGRLSNSCPIVAGKTYGLELPWHLEDAFAAEEAWLLPATETCTVCSEDRKVTELPLRITSDCKHKPTLCKDCLGQWIHSSMDTLTWERLKCPECPELLKFDDVRRYAFREDFDRYDALATRAALKSIRDFRWCLSTSCESGQIHDPKCKMFKCIACKAKHCVHHEVPWHSKETCEEYDKRNRRRRKEEKASEQTIKQTSKACPECKRAVHKFTGCNHITCLCGHEWCYICFATFRRNQHGFLYCRHNRGCTESDPFADIVDPDGNPQIPDILNLGVPGHRIPPRPAHPHGGGFTGFRAVLAENLEQIAARLGPPPPPHPGGPLERDGDGADNLPQERRDNLPPARQQWQPGELFLRAWNNGVAANVAAAQAHDLPLRFRRRMADDFGEMNEMMDELDIDFARRLRDFIDVARQT